MRATLAVAAAAAVGVIGALILGEYPFRGWTVLASGVVFGLFIGEAAVGVAKRKAVWLGAAAAVIGLAGMTWAAWIAEGHDLSYLGPAGWTAIVLAGASAGLRTGWSRPAAGTRTAPAQEPSTGEHPA